MTFLAFAQVVEEEVAGASPGIYPHLDAWGWQIGLAFFFVSLAADLLLITNLHALVRWSKDGGRSRLSPWTDALLLASLVGILLFLWLDLTNKGQGPRFWLIFEPTSVMLWGSWVIGLSLLRALARIAQRVRDVPLPGFLGAFVRGVAVRADLAGRDLLVANIVLGLALGLYTGLLLYSIAARPFWTSLFLPFLLLVSGAAMADGVIALTRRRTEPESSPVLFLALVGAALALALGYALTTPLVLQTVPLAEAFRIAGPGWFGPAFWTLGLGLGLAVPLVLLLAGWLSRSVRPFADRFAPWLVLLGGVALRQVLVYAGQVHP